MKQLLLCLVWCLPWSLMGAPAERQDVNFLVITADDMNWNSVGCFGSPMEGITPSLDRLAGQGMRFAQAHVASTVCMSSRNAINSGRLPHRSGGEGFHHFRLSDISTIPRTSSRNGYRVGILEKVSHSTPYPDAPWDLAEEMGRNTELFYEEAGAFMEDAAKAGRQFYLVVNSHYPHQPYHTHSSEGQELSSRKGKPAWSHLGPIFHPAEVFVPEFVPDTPEVRGELADYYCSVRRCDYVAGRLIDLLEVRKIAQNTIVFFLADHGMSAPSAKGNAYPNSTRTPTIVRWPGKITPGTVDTRNFVSTMDIFPTLLDVAGIKFPGGFDGVSLLPAFAGKDLADRGDVFFTQFYAKNGNGQYNMRTALTHRYAYVFNAFYNGQRLYTTTSLSRSFFQAIVSLGKADPAWKALPEFLLHAPRNSLDHWLRLAAPLLSETCVWPMKCFSKKA